MKEEELGCLANALIAVFAIVFIFVVAMMSDALTNLKSDMKAVGIEKFVHCNNTQSNWVEIVWKKNKEDQTK